jgi:hypothetical protein
VWATFVFIVPESMKFKMWKLEETYLLSGKKNFYIQIQIYLWEVEPPQRYIWSPDYAL